MSSQHSVPFRTFPPEVDEVKIEGNDDADDVKKRPGAALPHK
jgi:hypothetical protein